MTEETNEQALPDVPERKKPGWPKGKPRKRVAEVRTPVRQQEVTSIDDYYDDDENDRLRIPKEIIPDGMDYQWVTATILGQPQPQRRTRFERKGWRTVPAERHDGLFMPRGYKGEIEVDGLVLYERSMELTLRARARNNAKAREQVQVKEAQLKGGDLKTSLDSRHQSAVSSNRINKSYERMPIPEE